MLMYPEARLPTGSEGQSLTDIIYQLKSNKSLAEFIVASVGAINRGITYLEARGFGKIRCRLISLKETEPHSRGRVKLSLNDQRLLVVEAVYALVGGERVMIPFELCPDLVFEGGYCEYEIKYRESIPRISQLTSDDKELELWDGLAALLPYFVKSELLSNEDAEEAKRAREEFEKGVFEYEYLLGGGEPKETIYKHF